MTVQIKIKRPILKLPFKAKSQYLTQNSKQIWLKPKVLDEIECHGVSPTHDSKFK
jgi:hypothetical protein